jgi:hypothetical protein
MYIKRANRILRNAYFNAEGGEGGSSGGEGGEGGAPEPKTYSEDEFNQIQSQLEAIQRKNDELLGETKKAKKLKAEADEKARLEAAAKAEKDGDFEHLFKSSEEKRQEYEKQLNELQSSISREKCENKALELAGKIANGSNEAMLLSGHIMQRLRFEEGNYTVLDGAGNPSIMKMDDLANEFLSNELYGSLVKGNQASGGGAPGGQGSGAAKTLSRAEFDKMSPSAKMDFTKSGGKLTD